MKKDTNNNIVAMPGLHAFRFLLEKEFRQMIRNRLLPRVFIILPIVLTLVVPLVATQEISNLNFCVIDNDRSARSRRLIEKTAAADCFHLAALAADDDEAMAMIEAGRADVILEIPRGFAKDLQRNAQADISVRGNAVNGIKGTLGTNYLTQIAMAFAEELTAESGGTATQQPGASINERYLFNATLDYKRYMIPALIGMLLILTVGFLPALNIVLEKEHGTIEQMNVTPVGKSPLIFAKLLPYWTVGIALIFYSLALVRLVYGFAPAGSVWHLLLIAVPFIAVMSAGGLIVSNYSDTTRQAALTMFFFLVIFILMSGLLTPVRSMPEWAQALSLANPLRYFVEAARMIFLKGSRLADLLPHFAALLAAGCLLGLWAVGSYRKR